MMKNKITKRLIIYFSIVLLIFTIIITILFVAIFGRYSKNIRKSELKQRAIAISETLSDYFSNNYKKGNRNGKGGYGAYIKFLDDIAMSKVWIVDRQAQTINIGNGHNIIQYSELPNVANILIQKVFEGEISFSSSFSELLDAPSITVGAPIFNNNKEVVAAVLLHGEIEGFEKTYKIGIFILILCLILALVLSTCIAIILSIRFVKPLKQMDIAAQKLIEGDYTIKTNINQNDEIGVLASNIDELSKRLYEISLENKKLDELKKDFISNISHELRTPVTVIRGSLEALYDGIITDELQVKEYYEQMLSDTIHLQRLVNDLLELSRLQNIDFSIEMRELNLIDVLSDAIRSVKRIALEKQVSIVFENNNFIAIMQGDYHRLRQMFIIVIDNAIKFSKTNNKIDIKVYINNATCKIDIIDYGCGIKEEDLPYIFERFYHVKSQQNNMGTGLGLAIARQIAVRHDIQIVCTSTVDVKTIFSFKLNILPYKD